MADARCEQVRADLSAAADGEDVVVDHDHVAGCASCVAFSTGVRSLRAALRFEVLDVAPDVAPAVLAAIEPRRRARLLPAAAVAAAVGLAVGSIAGWPSGDEDGIAAADVPGLVVAAQRDVASLAAELTVVDDGRTLVGSLRYRAPESVVAELGDRRLAVQDGTAALGDVVLTGVEPFADEVPSPLDLVLPASAFTIAGEPVALGERTIEDRRAVGVAVTAAQVGDVLATLRRLGAGTAVHPTDAVSLWLDADTLVPLELDVRAAAAPDRARWAAARGVDVAAGDTVLSVRYRDVRVNDALAVDGMAPIPGAGGRDLGFREGAVTTTPSWLPDGMTAWRRGRVGDVEVSAWTDGRAWVKVRATTAWRGDRLFGDVGPAVRVVRSGDGVAYVADGGGAIAVHGRDIDVVVTGSVSPQSLRRVAASLAVVGTRVPDAWAEAGTMTLAEVAEVAPVLVLDEDAGFAAPSARADGDTVTLTFAGAGERVVTLASRPGRALRPPTDPDAVGVELRGVVARWSPASGDLEWVEDGRVWSMRSATVSLGELVALASDLVDQ